jgi:hypothetical protein
MSPVRGTADLDREHFVWGHWTRRQIKFAAGPGLLAVILFMTGAVTKAQTGRDAPLATAFAVLCSGIAAAILGFPAHRGFLARLHRQHLGPHTYVNGPVTTLPKEFQTRAYRRAQRRLAALSAPFEGFDEAGRYIVAGGVTRVLRVNPIDMELRSEREREHLGKRFAHLLNTSDAAIAVHVAGEPISFERETARLRGLALAPQVNSEAKDYADFLETMAGYRRQCYIACWGADAVAADMRATIVAEQLARMGLDTHRPTPSEMAALTALLSGGQVPHRNYPSEPTVRGA